MWGWLLISLELSCKMAFRSKLSRLCHHVVQGVRALRTLRGTYTYGCEGFGG